MSEGIVMAGCDKCDNTEWDRTSVGLGIAGVLAVILLGEYVIHSNLIEPSLNTQVGFVATMALTAAGAVKSAAVGLAAV